MKRLPARLTVVVLFILAALGAQSTWGPITRSQELLPDDELAEMPSAETAGTTTSRIPELPAYSTHVIPLENGRYSGAHYASARALSYDGRVGVIGCGSADDPDPTENPLCFVLRRPEAFEKPFDQVTPDEDTIRDDTSYPRVQKRSQATKTTGDVTKISNPIVFADVDATSQHPTICDPVTSHNPFACGPDKKNDCYDLTIVTSPQGTGPFLWSRKIRIMVKNPKTAAAEIVNIIPFGTAPARSGYLGTGTVLEPTMDQTIGRLVVMHHQSPEALRYALMDVACDAGTLQPYPFREISAMHTDTRMKNFPVAAFPLRDYENKPIPPGNVIAGAYPWIDRGGKNLFFTYAVSSLYYTYFDTQTQRTVVAARYPDLGAPQNSADPDNKTPDPPTKPADIAKIVDTQPRLGLTVTGLWTNGKLIALTNRLDHTHLGFLGKPAADRTLGLYEGGTVRAGASTITIINSAENQLNFEDNVISHRVDDVTWRVSVNRSTDEVSFDDLLDRNYLIVSHMNPSILFSNGYHGRYRDGFAWNSPTDDFGGSGFKNQPHLANDATSIAKSLVAADASTDLRTLYTWNVPAFGAVLGPDSRTEPVAAGGVEGEGMWLNGAQQRIEYTIPVQAQDRLPAFQGSTWTTSLWLDGRGDVGTEQRVLTFPDASYLNVKNDADGQTHLIFGKAALRRELTPPPALSVAPRKWTHLAVQSKLGTLPEVAVYVNGMRYWDSADAGDSYFRMGDGTLASKLTIGHVAGLTTPTGALRPFRGWIDDFKVLARALNPESSCNQARGTLVNVSDAGLGSGDARSVLPDLYPASTHSTIATAIGRPGRFFCEIPLPAVMPATTDLAPICTDKIRTRAFEDHKECVHRQVLFPEGPLYAREARPEARNNTNCLRCHDATGRHPAKSLRIDALYGGLQLVPPAPRAETDVRRQPMQPAQQLFGWIPRNLFGADHPLDGVTDEQGGLATDRAGIGVLVDEYMLPRTRP